MDSQPTERKPGEGEGVQDAQSVKTLPQRGCIAERLDDGDDHSPLSLNFSTGKQEQNPQPPQCEQVISHFMLKPFG